MTTTQLEKLFYKEPFQPFRLRLKSGEQITVRRPRKASVSGKQIAVFGISRLHNGFGKEGLRIVPVDRVLTAEYVGADAT